MTRNSSVSRFTISINKYKKRFTIRTILLENSTLQYSKTGGTLPNVCTPGWDDFISPFYTLGWDDFIPYYYTPVWDDFIPPYHTLGWDDFIPPYCTPHNFVCPVIMEVQPRGMFMRTLILPYKVLIVML